MMMVFYAKYYFYLEILLLQRNFLARLDIGILVIEFNRFTRLTRDSNLSPFNHVDLKSSLGNIVSFVILPDNISRKW